VQGARRRFGWISLNGCWLLTGDEVVLLDFGPSFRFKVFYVDAVLDEDG
jgi:hypothetical protein